MRSSSSICSAVQPCPVSGVDPSLLHRLNVHFDRALGFAVTPKTRQEAGAIPWHLVRWQLVAIALLAVASAIGIIQLYLGAISVLGVGVNLFWVLFDVLILSVVFQAVRYRGHQPEGA